jgi:uncharacterized heparinase superfamily protein
LRLASLSLYFHTLRHLRASQIRARAWRAVRSIRAEMDPAPRRREAVHQWQPACFAPKTLEGAARFTSLGETHDIVGADAWNASARSALWLYNLHYFDDLNARDADARLTWHRDLLQRWIVENPPGTGIGWQPYPTSRRIINWIKWHLGGHDAGTEVIHNLAVQCRWLSHDLEFHIGGNHLLANAKALVFAGAFFAGGEGDRWLREGLRILTAEVEEQILDDGGHYERSPMYHAAVLEDLLDTINVLDAFGLDAPEALRPRARQMLDWCAVMTPPDGEVAFFNDSAFGIAPIFSELEAYSARLRLSSTATAPAFAVLKSSGYVRAVAGEAWLACDCAPVGPDYLPGHAHADTLSFELSLGEARWLVNSGTSVYGTAAERQRQRGTAAHNTVVVDGQDSSQVWGGFRVAKRARSTLEIARMSGQVAEVAASHDGYCRLPGRNVHRRRWDLDPTSLSIHDHVSGGFSRATAHFHLHPDVAAEQVSPMEVRLHRDARTMRLVVHGASRLELSRSTWHPRFGVSEGNWRVSADFAGAELRARFDWSRST